MCYWLLPISARAAAESMFVEGALQAQALLSCRSYGLDVPSTVLPFAGKEVLLLFPSSPNSLVSPYSGVLRIHEFLPSRRMEI